MLLWFYKANQNLFFLLCTLTNLIKWFLYCKDFQILMNIYLKLIKIRHYFGPFFSLKSQKLQKFEYFYALTFTQNGIAVSVVSNYFPWKVLPGWKTNTSKLFENFQQNSFGFTHKFVSGICAKTYSKQHRKI